MRRRRREEKRKRRKEWKKKRKAIEEVKYVTVANATEEVMLESRESR